MLSNTNSWSAVTNGYASLADALTATNRYIEYIEKNDSPLISQNRAPKVQDVVAYQTGSTNRLQVGADGTVYMAGSADLRVKIDDAPEDLDSILTRWTVVGPGNVTNIDVVAGTNYNIVCATSGLYSVSVQAQDKDMARNTWAGNVSRRMSNVVDRLIYLEFPSGGNSTYTFHEPDYYNDSDYSWFRVCSYPPMPNDLYVKIDTMPRHPNAEILFMNPDGLCSNTVVTIPANQTKSRDIKIDECSGTEFSGGSTKVDIAAAVTNTNGYGETPYKDLFCPITSTVEVVNSPPYIDVEIQNGSETYIPVYVYTNIAVSSFSIDGGVYYPDHYSDQPVTMRLKWEIYDGRIDMSKGFRIGFRFLTSRDSFTTDGHNNTEMRVARPHVEIIEGLLSGESEFDGSCVGNRYEAEGVAEVTFTFLDFQFYNTSTRGIPERPLYRKWEAFRAASQVEIYLMATDADNARSAEGVDTIRIPRREVWRGDWHNPQAQ